MLFFVYLLSEFSLLNLHANVLKKKTNNKAFWVVSSALSHLLDNVCINCLCKRIVSMCMYLCGNACWSGQMVRLYGAEATGIRSPGQMGRDAFAPEVAKLSAFCLSSFSSLTLSLCLNCFFHLSHPFFLSFASTFSISLAHTIELGSVSAIEWLELMANYLPLGCLACVWMEGK